MKCENSYAIAGKKNMGINDVIAKNIISIKN